MFKRILVPLDGSARAERALPVAARIAHASGGTVVLLRVADILTEYGASVYGSYVAQTPLLIEGVLETELARAKDYLAGVAQSESLAGIKTETLALSGAVAPAILDLARTQQVDLIVICSHGYTGFKRWLLGSVAQKIARYSPVPVLVLREDGSAPTCSYPDTLRPLHTLMALVALDGSELAERALAPAAHLVAALAAPAPGTLLLTKVVKQQIAIPESEWSYREYADPDIDEEKAYLNRVADDLCEGSPADLDLTISTTVAIGENVADTLIRIAENGKDAKAVRMFCNCDLIVIATHGRGGLQRWAMGSVTESVLGATKLPLLIMRPQEQHTKAEKQSIREEKTEDKVPTWAGLF